MNIVIRASCISLLKRWIDPGIQWWERYYYEGITEVSVLSDSFRRLPYN